MPPYVTTWSRSGNACTSYDSSEALEDDDAHDVEAPRNRAWRIGGGDPGAGARSRLEAQAAPPSLHRVGSFLLRRAAGGGRARAAALHRAALRRADVLRPAAAALDQLQYSAAVTSTPRPSSSP